ncbi:hypothetical protein N7471_008424 [Penicillium samsonianum]|uniref:uncharacterized protein n=1 Tax=Penicillium samsonianum TaxID=1882272 RepID=UPI0025499273|nr:uncharacterized protein N7471_008424 [Penicillium samsonianum]KAJ6133209.1 hypothetical protein N7471_008424 [Penicillium samsonianum]
MGPSRAGYQTMQMERVLQQMPHYGDGSHFRYQKLCKHNKIHRFIGGNAWANNMITQAFVQYGVWADEALSTPQSSRAASPSIAQPRFPISSTRHMKAHRH